MDKTFLNTFLTDAEIAALTRIADDALTFNALQKIVLAGVYYRGVLLPGMEPQATSNAALSLAFSADAKTNEELGADVRALAEGVRFVESGFSRLRGLKSPVENLPRKGNKAR